MESSHRTLHRLALVWGAVVWLGCRPPTATPGSASTAPEAISKAGAAPAVRSEAEVLAASDLPLQVRQPLATDPMGVTVHRLSNGMTVYLSENHEKPQVSAWIGVRVGGRMDPPESTGLAHYLEHMLFKGSDEFGTLDAAAESVAVDRVRELYRRLRHTRDAAERQAILVEIDAQTQAMAAFSIPNELDRLYSTLGVEGVNAYTSFEETVYVGDVPSNRLAAWSRVEAERFADPVFRLFLPELEAVYEEKNLSLDSPERRVLQAALEALFPHHPYGTQTILGDVEHLKTPAFDDMEAFFEDWYAPNNMAIAIAGDTDAKSLLPVLERSFGRLRARTLPTAAHGRITPLPARVAVDVQAPGAESVTISWLAPATGHADDVVMAVIDRLMHDRNFGLLELELGLEQRVAEVGCWYWELNEAGIFTINAKAKRGQSLDEVEAEVRRVVAKLVAGGFEDTDVEAAKLQEHIDDLKQLEGNEGRVSKMMDAFIGHLEWPQVVDRTRRFQEVSRADVVRVARATLGEASVVVRRREGQPSVPKLEKPVITPIPIDASRKSAFATEIEAMPAEELSPKWLVEGEHYVHETLPSGPLIVAKNPRNELFTLTYAFKQGYAKEPLLCFALDLLKVSGTQDLPAAALQRRLYQLGTTIDTSCDAETSRLHVTGIDKHLEESVALLDAWLAKPSFEPQAVEKLLATVLTERKSLLEEDHSLTEALDDYAKYGAASAWLKQPSTRTLQRARPAQLRRVLQSVPQVQRRTMYFGPRTAQEVVPVLARRGRFRDPGPTWVRRYARRSEPTVLFLHNDGAKANVRLVLPQAPIDLEARAVAQLFHEYLSGGMSSLVFQEIRESRGLAYSASAYYVRPSVPADETALVGSLSTQADKTVDASTALLEVLRRPELVPSRLENARVSLDQWYRRTRVDPRSVVWWVAGWDELGLERDERPELWATVLASELGVVEAFARKVGESTPTIAIIGDRARVDLAALGRLGKVVELQPDDLYSFGPLPPSSTTRSADPPSP